jgi:hypothetical protein
MELREVSYDRLAVPLGSPPPALLTYPLAIELGLGDERQLLCIEI